MVYRKRHQGRHRFEGIDIAENQALQFEGVATDMDGLTMSCDSSGDAVFECTAGGAEIKVLAGDTLILPKTKITDLEITGSVLFADISTDTWTIRDNSTFQFEGVAEDMDGCTMICDSAGDMEIAVTAGKLTFDTSDNSILMTGETLTVGTLTDETCSISGGNITGVTAITGTTVNATNFNANDTTSCFSIADSTGELTISAFTLVQQYQTENDKVLEVTGGATDLTHGVRQGTLAVSLTRSDSYNMTGTDGNPDCAFKLSSKNESVSGTNVNVRGMDISAKNDDSGTAGWLNAGFLTVENDGASIVSASVLELNVKNLATCSDDLVGLRIHDSSSVGATGDFYGLKFTGQYNIDREYGIHFNSTLGSWTNAISLAGTVTNVLDFADVDGTNGLTVGTYVSADANPTGCIKIDGAGTPEYIYVYTNPVTYS